MERLEKREVLTAYINELMIDPLFESTSRDQYFEFRGEPGEALAQGTYFVVVEDRDDIFTGPGSILATFDLSGIAFGDNGFLVLQQQGTQFGLGRGIQPDGPQPNVLISTAPGFSGLPNNMFSSVAGGGVLDSILGSSTYFLIQSDVPPALSADIDLDNDGLMDPDGVTKDWTILDSVSLHHGVFQGPVAYGQIALVRTHLGEPPVTVAPGVEVVYTDGYGYAARVGDSTGHARTDWVAGTVRDVGTTAEPIFQFENGIFGTPIPRVFTGRDIDHLGESNFISAAQGTIVERIVNSDGTESLIPVPGVTYLADANGNGGRDVLRFRADADSFVVGTDLTNVFPGVTLTTVDLAGDVFSFPVQSTARSFQFPDGDRIFSHSGIGFFNSSRVLRMDFYRPARTVSIDVIGDSNFSPTFGRLEAFNAAGESLGFVRSRALFRDGRQRLQLNFRDDAIAYAVAYSDENYSETGSTLGSSPFGRFDAIEYSQAEAISTTDENGRFALRGLVPGNYNIIPLSTGDFQTSEPLPSANLRVTRYENIDLSSAAFRNALPEIEPASFVIDENPSIGQSLGFINAFDSNDNQVLSFGIANSDAVEIDAVTGELFVTNPAAFNFESSPTVAFTVVVADSSGGVATRDVQVTVNNLNESPSVTLTPYQITEDTIVGAVVGIVEGVDPEVPNSPLRFEIIGGTGANLLGINPTTGLIQVVQPAGLNAEVAPTLSLLVAVSDQSSPPMTTVVDVFVSVTDSNDRPEIVSTVFAVSESAGRGTSIGRVQVTDEDASQNYAFTLIGNAGGRFSIEQATGMLFVAGPLDFEQAAFHEVRVQVIDNGSPPRGSAQTIRINVTNVVEPAQIAVRQFTVAEGASAGESLGTLEVNDPEGRTGIRFASPRTDGPQALFGGRVVLDAVSGELTVAPGAVFDADVPNPRLVDRVRVLDGTNVIGEAEVVLQVSGVNEAPIVVGNQRLGLPQGLPSGRAFATVQFTDPERDSVSFEVLGDAAELFAVNQSGQIRVLAGANVEFPTSGEIEVPLRVTDANGLQSTASVIVFGAPRPRFSTPLANQSLVAGTAFQYSFPFQFRTENILGVELAGTLPDGLRFDPTIARVSGIAAPSAVGVFNITVRVNELDGEMAVLKEVSFTLQISHSDKPLFNRVVNFDVDGNGRVEALDALRIINFLTRTGGGGQSNDFLNLAQYFVDVNGDNQIAAIDALRVINFISRRARQPEGEGAAGFAMQMDERLQSSDVAIAELYAEPALF